MLIYVASPYSHEDPAVRQERYEIVRDYVEVTFLESPQMVRLSPIVYWHPTAIAKDMPTDANHYLTHNRSLLWGCDKVELMQIPGWDTSRGVELELDWAEAMNIPVQRISV